MGDKALCIGGPWDGTMRAVPPSGRMVDAPGGVVYHFQATGGHGFWIAHRLMTASELVGYLMESYSGHAGDDDDDED